MISTIDLLHKPFLKDSKKIKLLQEAFLMKREAVCSEH